MFMAIFMTYKKFKKKKFVENLFLKGGRIGIMHIYTAESELAAFWLGFE